VAIRDQQLETLAGEINELFDNLDKSKKRDADLEAIRTKLADFDNPLDTMHLDLKNLDVSVKKKYMQKYRAYKNMKKEWEQKLEWQKKNSTRDALMDGHANEKTGADFDTPDALMQHGSAVQADTKASLERSLGIVKDARDLGTAVAQKLEAQNKQLSNMVDEVASIGSTLDRANKTLKRIARKVATDKYLWVLIALIIAAVIFIIVWKNSKAGKDSNVNAPTVNTGLSVQGPFPFE